MPKKPKTRKSDRNRVNFSNPKVKLVSSYLILGENRLTKSEILSLANKDIFYQMKNSGFLKEKENGAFAGTKKFQDYIKQSEGKRLSSSSSSLHSQSVRNTLSFVPREILLRGSYKSSPDIEKQFKRTEKTPSFREKTTILKRNLEAELANADAERNRPCSTEEEHLRKELQYSARKEAILSRMDWLNERTALTPDYQMTLTHDELQQYINKLADYRDTLSDGCKAYEVYNAAIEKLKNIPPSDSSITLNVEVITNSYGERELALHRNFEFLDGNPQIFLM